jgi:hypothetical protein
MQSNDAPHSAASDLAAKLRLVGRLGAAQAEPSPPSIIETIELLPPFGAVPTSLPTSRESTATDTRNSRPRAFSPFGLRSLLSPPADFLQLFFG